MRLRASQLLVLLLALCSGCDYIPGLPGPTCGDVQCEMQVSTSNVVYDFGEPIDLNFALSAATEFRARLFDDRLCDLRFIVTDTGGDLLAGYRNCITSKREMPEAGFRDFGPADNKRATYKVSGTHRELIGPDSPLHFTLEARATIAEDGRILVWLAQDVYFEFIDATTVTISLAHYRHPLFEDERGFGA